MQNKVSHLLSNLRRNCGVEFACRILLSKDGVGISRLNLENLLPNTAIIDWKMPKRQKSLIQYPIWAKVRNPKPYRGQKNWPNPSLPISFLRDSCTKKFHKKEFYYYCWTFWTCTFWRLPSHLSIVVTKRTFYKSFTKLLKQNIFFLPKNNPSYISILIAFFTDIVFFQKKYQ